MSVESNWCTRRAGRMPGERWPGGMCGRGERCRGSTPMLTGLGIAEASPDPGLPAFPSRMPISFLNKGTQTSPEIVAASQTPALE